MPDVAPVTTATRPRSASSGGSVHPNIRARTIGPIREKLGTTVASKSTSAARASRESVFMASRAG